ncbi:MAG: GNAT family N-acetyltransferase [Elusimicrobia bacterium]|nr:GNAT family N-acetyltransferase [Elusimicrobiota bacterium]
MAALRPAAESDLPAIAEIYNQAVLRATGTFDTEPKTLEAQRDWFAHHGAAHPVIVAVESGRVVGWASMSPYSDRCAYARTAEVSVYVDEEARGRGLGGELLEGILAAGKEAGLLQVLARVAEGNEASLRLHAKRGFFEAGRLRQVGEKFGKVLDVHILQKSLALLLLLAAALPARAGVEESIRESVVRLTAGDVAGARAKAEEAVASAPRDPRAQEQLGNVALAALDPKAAEAAAGRALAAGETTSRLVLRANARLAGGNIEGGFLDAERAAALSPGSGTARLSLAVALELLGRPKAEVLREYRRAAELDPTQAPEVEAALRRLDPPAAAPAGARLGPILAILAVSALFGWIFGKAAKVGEAVPPSAELPALLPGAGRLTPRQALAAVDAACKAGSPDPLALAEALYSRLTGRPAFPRGTDRALGRYLPASDTAKGLPAGIDAFFARALDPEPSRRFSTAAELVGAFRSLVDPPVL